MSVLDNLKKIAAGLPANVKRTQTKRSEHRDEIHEVKGAITGIEKPMHPMQNSFGRLEVLQNR